MDWFLLKPKNLRRLTAVGLAVLAAVCLGGSAPAADDPPGPGIGLTPFGGGGPLEDYAVTQVTPAAKGFKAPVRIQVKFTLPDEKLQPGKVYHATVTWVASKAYHLNGELAGKPGIPHCTLRLKGERLETGAVSYTGTLQAAEFEEIAPTWHERTVTGDLAFRVKRGGGAGPVAATLEIDSSYCSEDGSCFLDTVTKRGGQQYEVKFQLGAEAAADEGLPATRRPPVVPFGQPVPEPPPAGTMVPPAEGTTAPATGPTPGPATGPGPTSTPGPGQRPDTETPPPGGPGKAPGTPPGKTPSGGGEGEPAIGATSPADLGMLTGVWAIVWSDLTMEQKVRELYKHGLPALLLFVGVFGVITTTLPCTYPLIPITARILGARAAVKPAAAGAEGAPAAAAPAGPTRGDALAASLFYMFGLTLIYGVIGGLGAAGSLLITNINNAAWFNIGIALLFGVLALGMFGLYEIKMPGFITNKLQGGPRPAGERGQGLAANAARGLTMGLLAAVLAGACTAPVIFAAVLLISQLKLGFWTGFVILAPFGFGFGLPYFLLTNFISRLPAPGQWMELVKIGFGTVILLAGFYFWDKTEPNPAVFALVLGTALLAVGLSFGAFDRLEAPVAASQRMRQVLTVGLVIAGGYFLVTGLQQTVNGETPASRLAGAGDGGPAPGATTAGIQWEPYQSFDPEKPDGSGRPVFIFFHSPSCYYCKKMLAGAFKDPAVVALTKKIRMIDADAKDPSEQLTALQEKFGYFSQPHSVFLNAQQQLAWGEDSLVRGYIDTAGVQQRFEKLLGGAGAAKP